MLAKTVGVSLLALACACPNHNSSFIEVGKDERVLTMAVREVEDGVVLVWGEYAGTLTQPGLACINPVGLEIKRVSRQKQSVYLDTTKIVDKLYCPCCFFLTNTGETHCWSVE